MSGIEARAYTTKLGEEVGLGVQGQTQEGQTSERTNAGVSKILRYLRISI